MKVFKLLFFLLAGSLIACGPSISEDIRAEYENLPEVLDFNVHVRPILSDKCFVCHGPDKAKQKAGLRLDLASMAYGELPQHPGARAITPGSLSKSEVFQRIMSDDPEIMMPDPVSNLSLTPYEKAVLVKWIEDGAEYKPHWSLIKPERPDLPLVREKEWVKDPIDQFVLKKLEDLGLEPAARADKEVLLRRVTFDLTGLPPTPEEVRAFLADDSEKAYEKVVDRLLASVHFGEKMAMDWMDLSRFADTHGYSIDGYRDMSPWRDWVIKSFNENMPYDQFVTWQLAGDLLPNPSKDQLLATGFNRLHPQNMEGGIIPEEFRVEYVIDRTNTFGKAFMALSVGCARCHDHKYDPISQKEYYEMTSFFNNVNEAGQISYDNAMPVPTMLLPTGEQVELLTYLKGKIRAKERDLEPIRQDEEVAFGNWLNEAGFSKLEKQSNPSGLKGHFTFDELTLENSMDRKQRGKMDRADSDDEMPVFTEGWQGKGLKLDGDAWLDCGNIGVYKRSHPFSIGLYVDIPKEIENGVIFHKGAGAALYNFRGYHLALKNNRLELLMAHTSPDNAIIEYGSDIPRDQWIHLMVTYDGSSKASGLRVYLDGREMKTTTQVDNLYKDIDFDQEKQPGLQIGARWRGKGIGGAIVDNIMSFDRELSALEVLMVADREAVNELVRKNKPELSPAEIDDLRTYFLFNYSSLYRMAIDDVEVLRTQYTDSLESVRELMVMKEMLKPRPAYVLKRGQYDAHGEEVFPDTPESILKFSDSLPRNRLGLAKWLLDPNHPLTSRVAVNRYWQSYFGLGLVRTSDDFGSQGEMPSHPALLDWLAIELIESGWDVKALQKLIVMSGTYQQDSRASDHLRAVDPENILLARGPAVRLTGEMLRDNALAASNLLNDSVGGKSVKPYQPDGLWRINGKSYEQDQGEDLYRRSLYTFWKRSVPNPTLATFDTPERSECTIRRQKTNTPLQALVLLNDPTFIECAKVMGVSIAEADDIQQGIKENFLKLTGRFPDQKELTVLMELHDRQLEKFKKDPDKTKGWITAGAAVLDQKLDLKEVAANAVVISTILNADATITKR